LTELEREKSPVDLKATGFASLAQGYEDANIDLNKIYWCLS
jgi:hypothetical protein